MMNNFPRLCSPVEGKHNDLRPHADGGLKLSRVRVCYKIELENGH